MKNEIDEYKSAIDIRDEEKITGIRDKDIWSQIGHIGVQCPTCSHTQRVQTIRYAACVKCGRKYKVYPENSKSRVVYCPKGKLHLLHELRSLQTRGKYQAIL